jgi:hypothetical protein
MFPAPSLNSFLLLLCLGFFTPTSVSAVLAHHPTHWYHVRLFQPLIENVRSHRILQSFGDYGALV